MKTISSSNIVRAMEEIFGRLGVVDTIVSDNGTQFTSKLFEKMCLLNNIQHIKTAPYHPASNGQCEKTVDTVKRTLKKLTPDGKNLSAHIPVFLQVFLSTPNPITRKSPFELMFNRKMLTPLNAMKPKDKHLTVENLAQDEAVNRRRRSRKLDFKTHDKVFVKQFANNKWSWESGNIIEPLGHAMFIVSLGYRRVARVHADQLRHDRSHRNS